MKISYIKKQIKVLINKGIFYILAGNIINKFTVFFGSIVLVRLLDKKTYGELTYIENLYGYIYILAGLGLANAVIRYIILAKEREKQAGIYSFLIKKGTFYNILLLVSFTFVLLIYHHPKEFESVKYLCIIYILILPFQFLIDVNLWTERAFFQNKRYMLYSCLLSIIAVLGKVLGSFKGDLITIILLFLSVYIVVAVLILICTKNKYFNRIKIENPNKKTKKEIKIFSFQYMLTNSLWSIFMLNDIFFLGRILKNPEIVADYKVAYVLPGTLALLSLSIGVFVTPYFIKHEDDKKWIRKNYWYTLFATVGVMGIATVLISIFARPIIVLIYGKDYLSIIPIMKKLLIVVFINNGFRYTTANLLSAVGKIKGNMITAVLGLILQILLNFILIPIYGSSGAAYSNIIVYSLMAIILFFILNKEYSLIISLKFGDRL